MIDPTRCRYATAPATRPDCQLLAVVRYGPIALCASCDQRRSTLGKGQPPTPLPPAPPVDPLAWIAQARRDLRAAEDTLTATVHRARQRGHPWSAIGAVLGISRQAAQQRFADPGAPQPDRTTGGGANSSRHGGAK
jgi:hypothetical protein